MQKNKIDAVKAVCNSAVRKLAVLSLAVAVSSGADASATPPKRNIPGLPSTTQGNETPQDRLRSLEKECEEKRQLLMLEKGKEASRLNKEISRLDRKIFDLRAQIEAEPEEPVEEIVEIVPENEEMKEEAEEQRENNVRTTTNTTLQYIVRDVTTLSGQMVQPQQNQQPRYFGGWLNPFNWFGCCM